MDEVKAARLGLGDGLVHQGILGIVAFRPAETTMTEPDLVALLEARDLITDGLHHAGSVTAKHRGKPVGHEDTLGPDLGINGIHPGSRQAHQHARGRGNLRSSSVRQLEYVRCTRFMHFNRLHRLASFSLRIMLSNSCSTR